MKESAKGRFFEKENTIYIHIYIFFGLGLDDLTIQPKFYDFLVSLPRNHGSGLSEPILSPGAIHKIGPVAKLCFSVLQEGGWLLW